jgi:hypothetical protein
MSSGLTKRARYDDVTGRAEGPEQHAQPYRALLSTATLDSDSTAGPRTPRRLGDARRRTDGHAGAPWNDGTVPRDLGHWNARRSYVVVLTHHRGPPTRRPQVSGSRASQLGLPALAPHTVDRDASSLPDQLPASWSLLPLPSRKSSSDVARSEGLAPPNLLIRRCTRRIDNVERPLFSRVSAGCGLLPAPFSGLGCRQRQPSNHRGLFTRLSPRGAFRCDEPRSVAAAHARGSHAA